MVGPVLGFGEHRHDWVMELRQTTGLIRSCGIGGAKRKEKKHVWRDCRWSDYSKQANTVLRNLQHLWCVKRMFTGKHLTIRRDHDNYNNVISFFASSAFSASAFFTSAILSLLPLLLHNSNSSLNALCRTIHPVEYHHHYVSLKSQQTCHFLISYIFSSFAYEIENVNDGRSVLAICCFCFQSVTIVYRSLLNWILIRQILLAVDPVTHCDFFWTVARCAEEQVPKEVIKWQTHQKNL